MKRLYTGETVFRENEAERAMAIAYLLGLVTGAAMVWVMVLVWVWLQFV